MRKLAKLGVTLAIALLSAAANAQQYVLIDLTAGSPYDYTSPSGINNLGQITGTGELTGTTEIHAFVYKQGQFQDLGLFGYGGAGGAAINNAGQVAINAEGPGTHALLYTNGKVKRLGSVDGGYSTAFGMNNLGDVVGSAVNGDGGTVGFSYVHGVFNDLSTLGIYRAYSINDAEQIVGASGYYWTQYGYVHGVSHGCLYANGTFTDLGSLTGNPRTNTEAFGINSAGQIVGYSTASDGLYHAFLYSSGVMQDLGTIGNANATAIAINGSGLIIGNLENAYGANLGAFVYANGAMTNLSDLLTGTGAQWSGLVVTGLNDSGAIIGYGTLNGGTHGFLALPVTGTPTQNTSGRIALEGIADLSAIDPDVPADLFHIAFRLPGTTTEVFGADVNLTPVGVGDPNGTYNFSGVPAGTYDVWIKGSKNLAVSVPGVVVSDNATIPDVLLSAGDADGNNMVDITDFGALVNAYGGTVAGLGGNYIPAADFNDDGSVDIADFGLLINNYGNVGAP